MIKKIQKPFSIKLSLFFLAMSIIVVIFWINSVIINELRDEARFQVGILAKSYSKAINSSNQDDLRFVMDVLLPSMNFPIIITSNNEISTGLNLNILPTYGSDEYNNIAWEMVEKMDRHFTPLSLVWEDIEWGKIHYSDPQVVSRLQWIPYLEISFGVIFLIIVLWGMQLIRKSENNLIYAGMARETAHQLGTPVSSLMGWSKLLNDQSSDTKNILNSMDQDILRLSEISERFSKIGSRPKLKNIIINDLILEICQYMRSRLPKNSRIKIEFYSTSNYFIRGDWVLISWALENLIKNSIDAINRKYGVIILNLSKINSEIQLDISDSGKGISRSNWKNIFRPGYSSKKRGWGLGLSLTERIVKDIHFGNIKVLQSKPGKTIIRLFFPI